METLLATLALIACHAELRKEKEKKTDKKGLHGWDNLLLSGMTKIIDGVKYKVRYAYMRPDGTKWLVLNVLGGFEGEFGDEVKA